MTIRLGTEIGSYRYAALTGVPRVLRETHRHLGPALARRGIELVPVVTSDRSDSPERDPHPYIASDPVLEKPITGPEDVDALLLLHPSPSIDFAGIASVRRLRPLPVIAMIHDLLPLVRPEWFLPGAERNFRVLVQQILHVADHIVVPSQQVADDYLRMKWRVAPSLHVLRSGTPFEQRPPRARRTTGIELLYVSTIEPRKGHGRLLDAFDSMCRQGVDVRLTLVGRIGWNVDRLVKRIRDHPRLGRELTWLPDADDMEVASMLEKCTIAVLPTEGEGFGLFLEEALSAGVMVVASDLPVFRERPNPNLLFFDDSPSSLVDTILTAAERTPTPLRPGDVRTMEDFSRDLHDLVVHTMLNRQS